MRLLLAVVDLFTLSLCIQIPHVGLDRTLPALWQLLDNVPFCPGFCDLFTVLTLFLVTFWIFGCCTISKRFAKTSCSVTRSQVRAWLLILFVVILQDSGAMWCEGSGMSMHTRGVSDPLTKIHAEEPHAALGQSTRFKTSSASKRSYRRAVQRASTHGFTWYRGQLCSAKQLGASTPSPSQIPDRPHHVTYQQPNRRTRLTVLNWNAGGLPAHDWDMMQQWLDLQDIDLIAIQETHWRFVSEWVQSRYYAIHSGGDSHAGLLCLISRRLCAQHDIS